MASNRRMASNNLIALGTIFRREVRRITRIWIQTLIPPAITMTLYFVIFGTLIGSRIGEIAHGFSYMQFLVPGLVIMSIIQNSYGNITSSFFGSKFGRYVEEMLVSPMPSWVILTGYVMGAMVRGIAVGILVTIIALFFTDLSVVHPWVVVSTALLTSVVFSLGGFINAVFAQNFDDIVIIPTFILAPLTYLGGVFYSIDMLGQPWRAISLGNPILYMVNAFRYGVLGISDVSLWIAYAVMLGFAAILVGISLYLLERGYGMRS